MPDKTTPGHEQQQGFCPAGCGSFDDRKPPVQPPACPLTVQPPQVVDPWGDKLGELDGGDPGTIVVDGCARPSRLLKLSNSQRSSVSRNAENTFSGN
jgi:hypothetical protein